MKALFFLTTMLFLTNCLLASSQIDFDATKPPLVASNQEKTKKQNVLESVFELLNVHAINKGVTVAPKDQPATFGKCTIKVYTEFDNGVVIEGTVVIEGIPWYECLAIKIYDVFSNDF